MAIDPEVIRSRLGYIERSLRLLEELQALSWEEFVHDPISVEATKHLLQTSIEAMIDICSHIVARLRLPMPDSSADLIRTLVEAHLLPAEHAQTYIEMVRFRNLLVHLYARATDREIYEVLQTSLGDFRTFIADVWRIMEAQASK